VDLLTTAVLWFIPILLSLTVHEWAHAASAYKLGDDTAARLGRMTFNPVSHIDPLGTLLLPILQLVSTGSVLFAWAKPVPVNPARFSRRVSMSKGNVIVSAAGPASNILLALAAAIGLGLSMRFGWSSEAAADFMQRMFILNIGLAVFNMLPIPPLDGSHVLHGLLPRHAAAAYERIFPYAPMLLLGVLFLGRGLIRWPMQVVYGWMAQVTQIIAG
jgi:Zn-dependent protease